MVMAWLALFDGLIGVTLALASIAAAHYSIAKPFVGFLLFAGGLLFAVLALLFSLIALIMMIVSPRRRVA
ncbi:MAG: hypothetical protein ACREQT_12245, partial [Candidatus Binataceae bacterium]